MLQVNKIIIAGFIFAGVFFAALSHAFQKWECDGSDAVEGPFCGNWGRHAETGGQNDATWGTYVTDYILFIEAAAMVVKAPGRGVVKQAIQAAFALDALRWLLDAIMHSFVSEAGGGHDFLYHSVSVLTILLSLARVLAALAAAKDAGECKCLPPHKTSAGGLALIGLILIILNFVYPTYEEAIISQAHNVTVGILVAVGCAANNLGWGAAVFISFLVYLAFHIMKPQGWSYPFHYSTDFNEEGLVRAASMILLAVLFGLYNAFVDTADEKRADAKEDLQLGLEDASDEEIEG